MKPSWLVAVSMLAACSGSNDEAASEDAAFDDMTNTLERAEGVEAEVMERQDRLEESLDASGDAGDEREP